MTLNILILDCHTLHTSPIHRGLEAMLQKRKRLLMYLRRKNYDRFSILITRLGLKDNHMRMVRWVC